MSEENVKPAHFWIGTLLTLSAVIVNIWQTSSQVSSQRYENQLTQISALVKDLSESINELSFQLESQTSVYVELQGCLQNGGDAKSCWSSIKSFDPVASAKAWRKLDSSINHANPFLVNQAELDLLGDLKGLRKGHQEKIRVNLPPDTAVKAGSASNAAIETRNQLHSIQNSLVKALSSRVRSSN